VAKQLAEALRISRACSETGVNEPVREQSRAAMAAYKALEAKR
jgi:hypothetical protein